MSSFLEITSISPRMFKEIASKIEFGKSAKNECWLWKGATTSQGYGYMRYKCEQQLLHRIMYSWFVGKIPKGRITDTQIDHLCNNRRCCNPKHLQLTNQRTNILRGNGPTAKNFKKKYCKRGHLLPEEENRSDGGRRCLICQRQMDRIYWQKRKKKMKRKLG